MSPEPRGAAWQHGTELRQSVSAAADRIDAIMLEAERAAEGIRREAAAEAERYLDERRREADLLVEGQLGRLQAAVDLFREQLKGSGAQGSALAFSVEAATHQRPPEVATETALAPDRHDDAVIRATQLLIQGTDRALIVEALRREFASADPEAIVAEILD